MGYFNVSTWNIEFVAFFLDTSVWVSMLAKPDFELIIVPYISYFSNIIQSISCTENEHEMEISTRKFSLMPYM